ncbi:uncharacterized protein LOC111285836 [Durio zibethinus]|uniref:Uncharacterized protein LOC111285836 n=1 Tax=Durio zibethinus TaxID=66656 RepID=A0A6P5XSI3_DURZI|nr:uncharacterized protein LOC111285836 [Durio zibethinus]XP_022731193.1 uncharacterized protein LOC111285836 [Durio zibethinus]
MEGKLVKGLSLKASIDVDKNRVIFVESDEDFIDILLSFLTMPIGSIIRLVRYQPPPVEIGCMNNLYGSVENFDVQLFQTEACKSMLLHPRNGAAAQSESLKLTVDDFEPLQYFCCESWECTASKYKLLSHYRNAICSCGKLMNREVDLLEKENKQMSFDARDRGVFVKGLARMLVSDELKIMPPLTATSFSLLSKLGLTDGSTIEEKTFDVGVDEVWNLLKFSLVSRIPLTETLLRKSPELNNEHYDQGSFTNFDQGRFPKSHSIETSNKYKRIYVQLIVSKSRKMVCYAEAGEDFVDLLFSFLTVPLGHVAKEMKNDTSRGCINHLFNSIQDLDTERYLKSNDHRAMLASPKLAWGYKLGNQPLGVEECKHQQRFYYHIDLTGMFPTPVLCSDEKLLPSSNSVQVSLLSVMDPKSHYKDAKSSGGFVKGPALFTVTDNLSITPISPVSSLSVLSKLKVPFNDIEERVVHVGKEEASRLLMAAFVTKSALTNAFIYEEPKQEFKGRNYGYY